MAEYTIVQVKRDSTLNWYASNPRLALGEPGVDMDLHRFKIGNGIDRWNELPYMDDDLYKLLDEQQQNTADQVQALLNKIAVNKLDADQKYNALTSEVRNTSRDLTGRMSAVESRQAEYQENLTERQQEYEEALSGDFEDTKAEVQAGLDEFNETRDSLTVRMNAIAGQATEDTEILDARVDAEEHIHPNLGENIRNIHSEVLGVKASGAEEKTARIAENEAERTARLIADETERAERIAADTAERTERISTDANIQGSLNAQAAHLTQEALTRKEQDEILQEQVHELSEGSIQQSVSLSREAEQRRKEIQQANERIDAETQARTNADSAIQEAIAQEKSARIVQDVALQTQVDALAEYDTFLQAQADDLADDDAALQRQADSLAQASIRTSLTVQALSTQQRAETQQRLAGDALLQAQADDLAGDDAALQRQADNLAQASIRTNLTVQALSTQQRAETQQRISADDALKTQADDLADDDAALQRQAEDLAQASIHTSLTVQALSTQQRAETQQRLAGDALLQAQADDLADDDSALQKQADDLAQASIRTSLTVQALSTQQRAETQQRISADDALNAQADELAAASIQQSLNLEREAAQRRKDTLSETQAREAGDASEATIRAEKDSDLQAQIAELHINNNISAQSGDQQLQLLSLAVLKNTLMQRDAHEKRKAEILHEALSRSEREDYLQSQIDNLAFAIMQVALNDYSARERFRQSIDEFYQAMADSGNMTYMGAKVASGNEINEMLIDVLSGTDSGAVSISEIPEELRDRVATSSEVSEMLAEIFPNYNKN